MAHCYLLERISNSLRRIARNRGTHWISASVAAAAVAVGPQAACAQSNLAQMSPEQYYRSSAAAPLPAVQTADGATSGLDPYTLEPIAHQIYDPGSYPGVAADAVHPIVQNWRTQRGPRYSNLYKQAVKDSLSGFYGGIEYLNLNITRPSDRVIGNYSNLPDFNDPALAGYVSPFFLGDDEQPLRGTLLPGQTWVIDSFLVNYQNSAGVVEVDQLVASPFFDQTNPLNNLDSVNFALDTFLNQPGANLIGPSFAATDFDENNSIRGTLGYQFANGVALEINVLDVGESNSRLGIEGDLRPRLEFDPTDTTLQLQDPDRQNIVYVPVVITDITLDLPGDGIGVLDLDTDTADLTGPLLPLYYDGGFAMNYDIDVNGSEATMFIPVPTTHRRWSFDWLFGARFLNVEEALTPGLTTTDTLGNTVLVTGIQSRTLPDSTVFTTGSNLVYQIGLGFPEIGDPRFTTITADVENNTYAAQFGFRTELDLDFITLGVSPKLALGVNHSEALVSTTQLLRAADVTTLTRSNSWEDFATLLDLGIYAKVNLNDWCRATIGYTLMYADSVAHAPDVLDFTVSATNPAIGVRQTTDDLVIQGLSLGFEIFFP